MDKDIYKGGQIWHAEWPMCWEVVLLFVDINEDGVPLFIINEIRNHGTFHREYNEVSYLFTPETIPRLLGKKAELVSPLQEVVA